VYEIFTDHVYTLPSHGANGEVNSLTVFISTFTERDSFYYNNHIDIVEFAQEKMYEHVEKAVFDHADYEDHDMHMYETIARQHSKNLVDKLLWFYDRVLYDSSTIRSKLMKMCENAITPPICILNILCQQVIEQRNAFLETRAAIIPER